MTDEQTAAAIVADSRNACDETAMEAAIVRALQAARKEGMDANDVDLVSPREASIESIVQELRNHNEEIGAGERSDEHLQMDAKYIAMVRHDGVSVETFAMMLTDAIMARESALDKHANAAVLRMCHEARMMNGIVDYSDQKATGVVRKVLGVLPVTADGCVAAPGGVIWPQLLIDNDEGGRVAWSLYDICTGDTCDDGEWLADKCWSTKEAAEAAKEAQ